MLGATVHQNQNCVWILSPQGAVSLVLYFTRFSLYGGKVDVYGGILPGGLLYTSIGETNATPPPLFIPYPTVTVVYTTSLRNATSTGRGFSAIYFGVSQSQLMPGNGFLRISSSSIISLFLVSFSANTKINKFAPYNVSTVFTGTNMINGRTNATYLIKPDSTSGRIIFAFSYLNLSCPNDYLEIFDGDSIYSNSIGRYCGSADSSTPGFGGRFDYYWIQTSSNVALMNLVSDSTTTYRNFEISFYSVGKTVSFVIFFPCRFMHCSDTSFILFSFFVYMH